MNIQPQNPQGFIAVNLNSTNTTIQSLLVAFGPQTKENHSHGVLFEGLPLRAFFFPPLLNEL